MVIKILLKLNSKCETKCSRYKKTQTRASTDKQLKRRIYNIFNFTNEKSYFFSFQKI